MRLTASASAIQVWEQSHNMDFLHIVLSSIFLFVGSMIFFLSYYNKQKLYMYMGLFILGMAIYAFTLTNVKQLFYSNEDVWIHIKIYTEFLLPVVLYLFYEHLFGAERFIRLAWKVHITFALLSILFIQFNIFELSQTFLPFNLLCLLSLSVMLFYTIRKVFQGDQEAKIYMSGVTIFLITGIHDVLRALGIVDSRVQLLVLGFFGLIVALSLIVGMRIRAVYKRLEQHNQSLAVLDELKDEFLANTSHELRTPLNGIIGIAESLLDGAAGPVSEAMRRNLNMIAASGMRLSNLVNDIQDYAKLKHKDIQLILEPVRVHDIVETVVAFLKPLAEKKQLQLSCHISQLPNIQADKNRLQQILYNLIGNAIKYTHEGTIEVLGKNEGSEIIFEIKDTGIGIPEDKWASIFVAFEQADGSASRSYDGTGLGLSITKHLVELHGGEIHLQSHVGQGSTFTFTLPCSESAEELTEIDERTNTEPARSSAWISASDTCMEYESARSDVEGNILIVEDDPINVQVIQNHLALRNWGTKVVSNGLDALEIISRYKIDLVLLDIMMPKLSGYEVCKRIRQTFPAEELPVIMLTAMNTAEDISKGYASGANDYLLKPFSKMELLARIEAHLRLRELELQKARSLFTKTELAILSYYAKYSGETRRQILDRFNAKRSHPITEKTLATHITNILKKVKASSMMEAAQTAKRKNLLQSSESTKHA